MSNIKTLLITGGSSGIGESIVKKFLKNDYIVINLDIKGNKELDNWENYKHYLIDLTNFELLKQTLAEVHNSYQITNIVSSAGKHLSANIEETTEEQYHALMRLNCDVNFYLLKYSVSHMKKSGGTIVFIGSDQTIIVKSNSTAYIASKRAAEALMLSLIPDYSKYNIRVISLAAGTIDTPLYRDAIKKYSDKSGIPLPDIEKSEALAQPIGRIGYAEEIAETVFFVTQSTKVGYLTGARISIDGGYTTL
ncbi:MAG: oxidoreductase [Burkholderiales bacterium]|jgi:NAD(P)-dependent dehydrogenase (short-subunit alcohol dehydrogenase family)|nr:oxidoreductase [Burkholderiales bacterium]